MPKNLKNTVSNVERFSCNPDIKSPSWDDLKTFVACVEERSFRKAAIKLGTSTATVSRHIDRLEKDLNLNLFVTVNSGKTLSEQGQSLYDDAKKMDHAAEELFLNRLMHDDDHFGEVNLSVTEGIGSYWVAPKVVDFTKRTSGISINLRTAMDSADVAKAEADISIQFTRPTNNDLIVAKLGYLHVYPFAAHSYLDIYGTPKEDRDLIDHSFIQQVAPQINEDEIFGYFTPDIKNNIVLRANGSAAHYNAIIHGSGIGILPTYICAIGTPVIPLDIGDRYTHYLEIFMTYHPDARKVSRKVETIEWIKEIFNPHTYPWFREEFMHPNEIFRHVEKQKKSRNYRRHGDR